MSFPPVHRTADHPGIPAISLTHQAEFPYDPNRQKGRLSPHTVEGMSQHLMSKTTIFPLFLPIVTTYTVTSEKRPLKALMNDSRLLAESFLEFREKAGFESYIIMEDSTFTAEALGCPIAFKQHEAVVTEPLSFSSINDLEDFRIPPLEECDRISVILEAVRRIGPLASPGKPLIVNTTAPFTVAAKLIGVETLLKKAIKEPAFVATLLEKVTGFICGFTQALKEAGAHLFFVAEPTASPNLISPKVLRGLLLPHLKLLMSKIPGTSVLHICGNIQPIVREMMETGATLLSLDQCVDLKNIRELAGDSILLGGNLDPGGQLYDQTAEEVTKAAQKCCRDGGPDRFVLMPGCSIVPGTPMENVRAMVDVAHQSAREAPWQSHSG
jgi:[methyl-Co(III) methanol-specific corrinoid protein]:coenzyme M methyltransferase